MDPTEITVKSLRGNGLLNRKWRAGLLSLCVNSDGKKAAKAECENSIHDGALEAIRGQ
jgi:hypothetical protein